MFKVYTNFLLLKCTNYPNQKQIATKQDFKGQSLFSIIEFHSTQKDQFHHPPEEILIIW